MISIGCVINEVIMIGCVIREVITIGCVGILMIKIGCVGILMIKIGCVVPCPWPWDPRLGLEFPTLLLFPLLLLWICDELTLPPSPLLPRACVLVVAVAVAVGYLDGGNRRCSSSTSMDSCSKSVCVPG